MRLCGWAGILNAVASTYSRSKTWDNLAPAGIVLDWLSTAGIASQTTEQPATTGKWLKACIFFHAPQIIIEYLLCVLHDHFSDGINACFLTGEGGTYVFHQRPSLPC